MVQARFIKIMENKFKERGLVMNFSNEQANDIFNSFYNLILNEIVFFKIK